MENSSAIDPYMYNSAITCWILIKKMCLLKGNDVEITSSKQREEFKATTFVKF